MTILAGGTPWCVDTPAERATPRTVHRVTCTGPADGKVIPLHNLKDETEESVRASTRPASTTSPRSPPPWSANPTRASPPSCRRRRSDPRPKGRLVFDPDPDTLAALKAKADEGSPGAKTLLRRYADRDMRRQIVLREINQGALAGMQTAITEQAADLVVEALDRYDASLETDYWDSHPWVCVPLSMFQKAVESRQRWQAKLARWQAAVDVVRQGAGTADIGAICARIEQLATEPPR